MKITKKAFIIIAAALASFALSPVAKAVLPPPDGGYPGFNTAEGQNALFSLTTGVANTANGWYSLFSDTGGSFNTGVGAGTLLFNTGDANTAVGIAALLFNTFGINNTAIGAAALLNNDVDNNTAVGAFSLNQNTTGNNNTATGVAALEDNTTADFNTAIGSHALGSNTTGDGNTANGFDALYSNTTGATNTAIGAQALFDNTTGLSNTAVGYNTLRNVTTGSGNIALGAGAGSAITANNDVICIGAPGPASVSDACFIGHIFGTTSSGGTAVFINSDGRLGTQVSSRRFKEEIKPMERSSEALYALKPVTFRYKKEFDPQAILQFGLVAEDVEAVNPDLVVRDKEGKVNTVHYEVINAMLLNEFLKEHRKVQEQETMIAQLNKEVKALVAHAREQDSKIESVSRQIEMNGHAARVVVSDQ